MRVDQQDHGNGDHSGAEQEPEPPAQPGYRAGLLSRLAGRPAAADQRRGEQDGEHQLKGHAHGGAVGMPRPVPVRCESRSAQAEQDEDGEQDDQEDAGGREPARHLRGTVRRLTGGSMAHHPAPNPTMPGAAAALRPAAAPPEDAYPDGG